MQITFLSAKIPLHKVFKSNEITSYPLAKNFTSHVEEVDTLEDYANKLREHAALNHCLYKGPLKSPLVNESRANKTDTIAETRVMVLDVDGLPIGGMSLKGEYDAERLTAVAKEVIKDIPELRDTAFVACASSSCGIADTARVHLHFFLDQAISPKSLKEYIKHLNLKYFVDKLTVTAHGKALKWLIDPCLADNSRIIYIAPPAFEGVKNPFTDNSQRVVVVPGLRQLASISAEVAKLDLEQNEQLQQAIITKCYKDKGLKYTRASYSVISNNKVINNPSRMSMRYAYHSDRFCYYNVGPTGDSNAYYVHLSNPTIVYNFKGEDPFLFEAADPDTYAEHLERFKGHTPAKEDRDTEKRPMVFLEGATNYLLTLYSPDEDAIIMDETATDKGKAELWFNHYGRTLPEQVPPAKLLFDPTTTKPFTEDPLTGYTLVNTFRPTEYMRKQYEAPVEGIEYNTATMLQFVCPTIYKVISHMLAYDDQVICHFLNWFAYIFQTRKKAQTCWVLQGTQGTGKGIFYRTVCRPLWGEKYAYEKQLSNFEDDKNGWERYALLVLIDELNMKTLSNHKKTEASLKSLITDDERTLRAMRKEQEQIRSYASLIMSTNDLNALTIPDNDRRFNVAPRQEVMLKDAFPEFIYDRENVDKALESEIEAMAAFLHNFKVNIPQAFIALNNEAKQMAREAGKTSSEAFFSAVRRGDLDYFTTVLEAREVDPTMASVAARCRTVVLKWLHDAKFERQTFVENEELRIMYHFVEGTREMTANKFGRLLSANGIERAQTLANRARGTRVTWCMPKDQVDAIVNSLPNEEKTKVEMATQVIHLNQVGDK